MRVQLADTHLTTHSPTQLPLACWYILNFSNAFFSDVLWSGSNVLGGAARLGGGPTAKPRLEPKLIVDCCGIRALDGPAVGGSSTGGRWTGSKLGRRVPCCSALMRSHAASASRSARLTSSTVSFASALTISIAAFTSGKASGPTVMAVMSFSTTPSANAARFVLFLSSSVRTRVGRPANLRAIATAQQLSESGCLCS
jgi:hypothetical protein